MTSLTPRIDFFENNHLINSDFYFWQRGGLASSMQVPHNSFVYGADRFSVYKFVSSASGNNAQVEASTATLPTFAQSNFKSSRVLRIQGPVGTFAVSGADEFSLRYVIEGYDYAPLHGKSMRLQFWVRNSVAGTYGVSFRNYTNTRSFVASYTVNQANTWEKKIIDLTLDLDPTAYNFDTSGGLVINWVLAAGSSRQTSPLNQWLSGNFMAPSGMSNAFLNTSQSNFYLSQVMLLQGGYDSSQDFSFRPAGKNISEELVMCQRYFEKSYPVNTAPGSTGGGLGFTHTQSSRTGLSGQAGSMFSFRTPKRATPTMTFYASSTGASGAFDSDAGVVSGPFNITPNDYGCSYTTGVSVYAWSGHWAADAEL